jgi:tetratricopeptide (TPR) repeat protein
MKKIASIFRQTTCVLLFSLFLIQCNQKNEKLTSQYSKPSAELKAFIDKITLNDNSETASKLKAELNISIRDSLLRSYLVENAGAISPSSYLENLKSYNKIRLPIPVSEGFVYEEKAYSFLQLTQLDSSIAYCLKSKALYNEIENTQGVIRTNFILATVYGLKGDFELNVNLLSESLKLAETIKDSASIYSAYNELAHSNYNHNEYTKALDYYKKSYVYYKSVNDTFMMSDVLGSMGSCYFHLGNPVESERVTQEALTLKKNLDDVIGVSLCLNGLAVCKISQKKWKEGAELLTRAREISHSVSDYRAESNMIHNLGICELEQGNIQKAESYFIEGIEFGKRTGVRDEGIIKCYEKLYQVNQRKKDYQTAFNYFQKYTNLKDSLYNVKNDKTLNELNVKYELKNKEITIAKLAEEKSIINLQRYLLLGFVAAIVIISLIIFSFQKEKNKKTKQILEKEKELKQQQLEAAQKELEFNKIQLSNFTTNLIDRNIVISELETKLAGTKEVEMNTIVDTETMFSLVQSKLLTDQDWLKFKALFEKAFPGFITKLRENFADLTAAEERIFLLLKVKNDTREMADALGISVESVRKGKYRLKKKLHLEETQSLDDFIKSY